MLHHSRHRNARNMAKSTYGNGYLRLRGKKWYGYVRTIAKDPETGNRVHDRIPVILGERANMTKGKAREALAREIAKRRGLVYGQCSGSERRPSDLRLVRSQPLYPPEERRLEGGDCQE